MSWPPRTPGRRGRARPSTRGGTMIGTARARWVTRTAAAGAAAAALVGATGSGASAAGGFTYGPDSTGGAYAYAYTDIASNGGTYVYGHVYDTAADGKC